MKKQFVLTWVWAVIAFAVIGISTVSAQDYITMPTDGDLIIQTVAVGGGTLKHDGVLNITSPYGKGSKLILGTTSVSGVVEKNMIFRLEFISDGWYRIKNKSYGYVTAVSPANNASLEVGNKDNSDNARFRFEDAGGGNFYITVFKSPKYYLNTKDTKTADNTLVVTHTAKGGNNTKWRVFYGRDGGLSNRVFGAYDKLASGDLAKKDIETRKLFEVWQKIKNPDEVKAALATIDKIMTRHDAGSGSKSKDPIGKILSAGEAAANNVSKVKDIPYVTKILTVKDGFNLFMRWRSSKSNQTLTETSSLLFDTVDYVGGFWVGGPYIEAMTGIARNLVDSVKYSVGWNTFTRMCNDPDVNNDKYEIVFDRANQDFSQRWYAAGYQKPPSMESDVDYKTLDELKDYLTALKIVKDAGLIK